MGLSWSQMRLGPKRRRAVYDDVTEVSSPELSYYVMTAVSVIIASYGLLLNSTAVVIGAMLVAPLMGPIFGIALGLSIGDRRMLWTAIKAEVLGVGLAVGVAALIGVMPLTMGFGSELMSRTQPTLFDLIIALAAGIAGAYALVDERVSPALPGVAVAVAVVPPLAACGLALSAHRWDLAGGAGLLFVANFLAINIAAALVFAFFGMVRVRPSEEGPPGEAQTIRHWLERFGLSLVALGLVAWFMTGTLSGLAHDYRLHDHLRKLITQAIQDTAGAQLQNLDYTRKPGELDVVAEVLTPRAFDADQVASIEKALRSQVAPDISLLVRSVLTSDTNGTGPVFGLVTPEAGAPEPTQETQTMTEVWNALVAGLKDIPGTDLVDLHKSQEGSQEVWIAVVQTPTAITPAQVAGLQARITTVAAAPQRLRVRSVPTVTADAEGYIYGHEPDEATAPPASQPTPAPEVQ